MVVFVYILQVISKPNPNETSWPCSDVRRGAEAFFSRLQKRGVRIWQGVEIFPELAVFIAQHAVFIAQQMLDHILGICNFFLKSGFFGHVLFPLFQNQSSYIYNNKLFCSL